jgi:hypothetical protein
MAISRYGLLPEIPPLQMPDRLDKHRISVNGGVMSTPVPCRFSGLQMITQVSERREEPSFKW